MTKILCVLALMASGCGLLKPACDASKIDEAAFNFRMGVMQDVKDGKCDKYEEVVKCPAYKARLVKLADATAEAC